MKYYKRVWIKGVLKCRCGNMPSPEEEDDPYDHGHSWNHPGTQQPSPPFSQHD